VEECKAFREALHCLLWLLKRMQRARILGNHVVWESKQRSDQGRLSMPNSEVYFAFHFVLYCFVCVWLGNGKLLEVLKMICALC
jgi:hypothetical protein